MRCTQGRIGRTGAHVAGIAELTADDVVYAPLPFFHAASLFTGWASAVHAGIPISTRKRFSASGTVPDIRAFGATFLTYTGKVLNYILSVPEAPDDATVPLRLAIGNEASEHDIKRLRPPLRLPRAGQLRLDRGRDHHPPRPVDARRARSASPTTR